MSTRLEIVDVSRVNADLALAVVTILEGKPVVGSVFEVDETRDRWRVAGITGVTSNQPEVRRTRQWRRLLSLQRVTGNGPLDIWQNLCGCDKPTGMSLATTRQLLRHPSRLLGSVARRVSSSCSASALPDDLSDLALGDEGVDEVDGGVLILLWEELEFLEAP